MSDREDKSGSEDTDKQSATVANIYQWATKLKDDILAETSGITHEVSEKAVAMLLNRLLDGVKAELEALDKKVESSESSADDVAEERSKITAKKEKYQSMIDQLES